MKNFKQILPAIKLFVFDVDGVLTDGSIYCYNDGQQVRVMNIKDGYALQLAIKKGYKVLIISGGKSEAITKRMEYLGITDVYLGVQHKLPVLQNYIAGHQISLDEVLYMGDDMPDLPCLKAVAAKTCPADAVTDVKQHVDYVSIYGGGKGCVRDVIEQVMRVQDKWHDEEAHVW